MIDMHVAFWNKFQSEHVPTKFAKEFFMSNVELTTDELDICNKLKDSCYDIFQSFAYGPSFKLYCTELKLHN